MFVLDTGNEESTSPAGRAEPPLQRGPVMHLD